MKRRFADQIVWITGGGSGIGLAVAEVFAMEGAIVAISGRRQNRLDEAVKAVEAKGGRALAVACDVSDEASIDMAVERIVAELGGIDVCIANAGFSVAGRVENLSAADWRRQFDTNVVGAAVTMSKAMPHLRARKGRAVLVASVSSFVYTPTLGAYQASKAALRAIGLTASAEMHGTGVSVTTIHPGFVESEIAQVDNQGVYRAHKKDRRPKNVMWPADKAARVMVDAIHARKREFVFTGHGKVGAMMGRLAPGLVHFAVTRSNRKGILVE